VHLVASSIPNMSASDVTVVDQYGDVLAAPGFNNTASTNSDATTQFDTQLGASLTSMLQNVLGPNHVAVKVAAQLNFNQTTTNSQTIQTTPKGTPVTAPTQSSTTKQTYIGTGTAPGGVLGTITQPVTGGNQNSNYTQTQTQNSYAIGQVNQTVKQAPGQIQRLSVAVLVDSKVKGVSVASIKSLVSAAAGLVAARGDTISVVKMPFATQNQALSSTAGGVSQLPSLLSLAKTIALAIAILVVIFLLLRSSSGEEREDLFMREIDTEPLNLAALNAAPSVPAISMPKNEQFIAEEVFDFIDQQPEDVAKLLRIWMNTRSR
jgi:flagellar M-ring protein FliF